MKDHNALRASFILFVLNASIPATASWADDCFLEDTYDCVLPESGGIVVWDSTGWNCDAWENASPLNRSSTMLDSCNMQGRRFCYGLLDVGVNHIELASHIVNDRRTKSIGSCDDYRDNRSADCAGTIGNVWLDFIANGGGAQCPNEFTDYNTVVDTESVGSDDLRIHGGLVPQDWIGVCTYQSCYIYYRPIYADGVWRVQVTRQGVAAGRRAVASHDFSDPVDCDFFPRDQLVIVDQRRELHVQVPGLKQACQWIETVEPLEE